MGEWRAHTENWLSSEEHGREDAADKAFAQAFAALPVVAPSADFVQRAVDAAWLARARRRRMVTVVGLAASVLLAAIAGSILYSIFDIAGGWLLTSATQAMTRSLTVALMAATTAVEWWSATARAGSAVAGVVIMPQSAAALVAIELVAAAALYTLHRLLRGELKFRNPGPLCV